MSCFFADLYLIYCTTDCSWNGILH